MTFELRLLFQLPYVTHRHGGKAPEITDRSFIVLIRVKKVNFPRIEYEFAVVRYKGLNPSL